MKRIFSIVPVLIAIAMMANPLLAQNKGEGEESLLPDIDPQDIEIRSQFQASFPGLSRQPILGFSSKPRVYQIDPDRMPFMETQEQVVADLPVSQLSRPVPPHYQPFKYAEDINTYGRAGMGNYITPEVKFWSVRRINPKSYISGAFDFTSSDGHLEEQESSYRFFDASGNYALKLGDSARLKVNAGVRNSFNHIFKVQPLSDRTPRKEYSGFDIGAELQQFKNSVTGWVLRANTRFYDVDLTTEHLSETSEQLVYNGSVAKRWAGPRPSETYAIKIGVRGGDQTNSLSDEWVTAQSGIEYERLVDYSTKIKASANVYYGQDNYNDQIYLGPSVEIQHPINEQLTVIGKASGKPYVSTAEEMHATNRFLNIRNDYRHSYQLQGSVKGRLEYSNVGSLVMGVSYEDISDFPLFRREQTTDSLGTEYYRFYETSYEDIRRLRAQVGISHQIVPERFWLSGEAYVQVPKLNGGGDIPYEERAGFTSNARIRLFKKLFLGAWADYTGPQEAEEFSTLKAYLLLGAQVDVQFTEKIGAYIKLRNILDEEYQRWPGYTERPFQAVGGVTIKL